MSPGEYCCTFTMGPRAPEFRVAENALLTVDLPMLADENTAALAVSVPTLPAT